MGNYTSKLFPHQDQEGKYVQTQVKMSSIAKDEVSTPVMAKRMSADPRSATVGIARTPIELVSTPPAVNKKIASAIPKYLQPKPYLETDVDQILPALTPEKRIPDPRSPNVAQERTPILVKTFKGYLSPIVKIQEGPDMLTPDGIDPRSPAMTFDRTPIHKSAPLNRSSSPIEDDGSEDNNVKMSYCETGGILDVPEIQALPKISTSTRNLEERMKSFEEQSAQTASRNLEERMKSFEVENAEDDAEKSTEHFSSSEYSDESENEDQITVIPNLKAIARFEEVQLTLNHEEDEVKIVREEINIAEEVVNLQIAPKSKNAEEKATIKVWRDSISPIPRPEEPSTYSEEIMIEFDDETVIKSKPEVKATKVEEKKPQIVNKQIKKVQKKETKGAFDEAGNEAGKNRTPLGCRSNNKSGIPTKSPQQVLRTIGLSTKQQENTPPNMKRFRPKVKGNGTQWDPDTSIVI